MLCGAPCTSTAQASLANEMAEFCTAREIMSSIGWTGNHQDVVGQMGRYMNIAGDAPMHLHMDFDAGTTCPPAINVGRRVSKIVFMYLLPHSRDRYRIATGNAKGKYPTTGQWRTVQLGRNAITHLRPLPPDMDDLFVPIECMATYAPLEQRYSVRALITAPRACPRSSPGLLDI